MSQQSSISEVVLSYDRLQLRHQAVRYMTHATAHPEPRAAPTHPLIAQWGQRMVLACADNFIPFLDKIGDGRALMDICYTYGNEAFFHSTVMHQVLKELARCNESFSEYPHSPVMPFWALGLLDRMVELGATHLFRTRPVAHVYSAVVTRLSPLFPGLCKDANRYHKYITDDTLQTILPVDLARFLRDLEWLGFEPQRTALVSAIIKYMHNDMTPDSLSYYAPDSTLLRDFWLPFLHELLVTINTTITTINTGEQDLNRQRLLRHQYHPLLTSTLTAYARAFVGDQPPDPNNPPDLRRVDMYVHRDPAFMRDCIDFLESPTRREARFQNWTKKEKYHAKTKADRLDVRCWHDKSTKPFTFVMTKISIADPEKHEAWAKRRDEFRAELERFRVVFECVGDQRGFAALMELRGAGGQSVDLLHRSHRSDLMRTAAAPATTRRATEAGLEEAGGGVSGHGNKRTRIA